MGKGRHCAAFLWPQYLRKVTRFNCSTLPHLFAATESICNKLSIFFHSANSGQQVSLSECLRDLEFILFKSERTSHPTTAGIKHVDRSARLAQ